MKHSIRILGVHPVSAPEPCHLIEMELTGPAAEIDFTDITQEDRQLPRDSWQVPYDEQMIFEDGQTTVWVFFFHYLKVSKPLLTPIGPITLPKVTPLPSRLREIEYLEP